MTNNLMYHFLLEKDWGNWWRFFSSKKMIRIILVPKTFVHMLEGLNELFSQEGFLHSSYCLYKRMYNERKKHGLNKLSPNKQTMTGSLMYHFLLDKDWDNWRWFFSSKKMIRLLQVHKTFVHEMTNNLTYHFLLEKDWDTWPRFLSSLNWRQHTGTNNMLMFSWILDPSHQALFQHPCKYEWSNSICSQT